MASNPFAPLRQNSSEADNDDNDEIPLLPISDAEDGGTELLTSSSPRARRVCCCFQTWSKLILFALLCIVLAVAIGMGIALYIANKYCASNSNETQSENCTTMNCINSASFVARNMEFDADPCDDFYQYSCGGFLNREEIPNGWPSVDNFMNLTRNIESTLHTSLEKGVLITDIQSVKNAKVWYQACVKEDISEQMNLQPLLKVVDELGGIPAVDNSKQPVLWDELVGRLREYNNHILVSLSIDVDARNSMRYILKFDQSDLGLYDRESYLNTTILQSYVYYGVEVLKTFPGADTFTLLAAMEDVVRFETAVAKLMKSVAEKRDVTANYRKLTLREMARELPGVDWLKFVNRFFPDEPLTEDEEVLNFGMDYLKNLIAEINRTPAKTVANYLMLRFIMRHESPGGQTFLNNNQEFRRALHGMTSEEARWLTCIAYLQANMDWIVGRIYIEESFDKSALGDLQVMVYNLKASFEEIIDKNEWMDADAKRVAKEKVSSMHENIGYPQWLFDNNHLDSEYKDYVFEDNKYFENMLLVLRLKAKESFSYLRSKVDKTEWISAPATVNAFYHPAFNQIMFPAGILQSPLYNPQYSKSLNYGAIGSVIGHEITHGFDDIGRLYDKDGNLRKWWSDVTSEQFQRQAACIVDQYSSYLEEGTNLTINGQQTEGENIADNGGMKASFKAYQKWVQNNGIELALPGLPLTHDKLFFVSFAQVWCNKMLPEYAVSRILSGVHSPDKYRVLGSLRNSADFSETFGCPAASNMNPNKKCTIW